MAKPAKTRRIVFAISLLILSAIPLVDVHSAQLTVPEKPSAQDAKAGPGGTAINVGRDLTINYRDPEVQRLLRLLEQQTEDARRREKDAAERISRLENENQQLRDEQAKAIAGVLEAARQPKPSPSGML
jgi:hypothetical protein